MPFIAYLSNVLSVGQDYPFIGGPQTGKKRHQRGFSAAGMSNYPVQLSPFKGTGNLL